MKSELKKIVVKNQPLDNIPKEVYTRGWGNGYVLLPPNHVLFGAHYDIINTCLLSISQHIHGGLTFSSIVTTELIKNFQGLERKDLGQWIVGFDTSHYGDNIDNWPKERVIEETERLKELLSYKNIKSFKNLNLFKIKLYKKDG